MRALCRGRPESNSAWQLDLAIALTAPREERCQVVDDHVGASERVIAVGRAERDPARTCGATGIDPDWRILEYRAPCRRHVEPSGTEQEPLRIGLAAHHHAGADDDLRARQAGRAKSHVCELRGTRRDDRQWVTGPQ